MILQKIELENFLSHNKTELSLRDGQKLLLDGKSGSGKSSVIEALVWCLYGKGRVDNRSLVKTGKKFAAVTVTISDDAKEYNVTRKVSPKGKQEILITERTVGTDSFLPIKVSGVKEVQAFVENELLHASYMLFINSIVYPQENAESFVRQSAAGRKDILMEIVGASDYDAYYDKTKEVLSVKEKFLSETKFQLESKERGIAEDEPLSIECASLEAEKVQLEERITSKSEILEEERKKLQARKMLEANISNIREKEEYFVFQQKSVENSIGSLKTREEELAKVDLDQKNQEIITCEKSIEEIESRQSQSSQWSDKMMELVRMSPVEVNFEKKKEDLNSQIISLIKKSIDACPELGKPCPVLVKERDARQADLEGQLEQVWKDEEQYKRERGDYEKKVAALGPKPQVSSDEIIRLRELKYRTSALRAEVQEISLFRKSQGERIAEKEKELALSKESYNKIKEEREALDLELAMSEDNSAAINLLDTELSALRQAQNTNSGRLYLAQRASERILTLRKEKELLTKNVVEMEADYEALLLLKDAFGNKGIKAIVIDYVLPRLEDKINDILGKMSDFRVRLDTQKQGAKEDVVLEGLFIDIINDQGEMLSFDAYSGGEKMKIQMSIFEALASLSRLKFRVFDETFVALDQESGDQFLLVLEEVQKDIRQMLCISHMPSIKDFFPEKVLVQKRNGDSFIAN